MNVIEYTGSTTGSDTPDLDEGAGGGRPRITVVYTTIEGTLAALEAASRLSKGLNAEIALLVAEEVPNYFPLTHAPIVFGSLERVCTAILQELQLEDEIAGTTIYFCRRRSECFRTALEPRSVVVLGERHGRWLWRERRLEHTLKALGYDALVVPALADGLHARAVERRLLETDPRVATV